MMRAVQIRPRIWKMMYALGVISLLVIICIRFINICPPSKDGIGSRFATQIEIETIDRRYSNALKPDEKLVFIPRNFKRIQVEEHLQKMIMKQGFDKCKTSTTKALGPHFLQDPLLAQHKFFPMHLTVME